MFSGKEKNPKIYNYAFKDWSIQAGNLIWKLKISNFSLVNIFAVDNSIYLSIK